MNYSYPLMENNILQDDINALIDLLRSDNPRLTNGKKVIEFEEAWSKWLNVKHSLFVNSGASANLITISALKYLYGEGGEIIVPTLTWISDIASVLLNGFTPVFVDIDPKNLGMSTDGIIKKLSNQTRAVFVTYVLGFNCLSDLLIKELNERNIPILEDVCESHGATFGNQKLGSIGLASNFSFYYAHHLSTVEGGMVSTNDDKFYDCLKMLRSHGMVREAYLEETKSYYKNTYPDIHPEFTFAYPSFNVRSTEINAVIGLSQLPRLSDAIEKRNNNFRTFISNIDDNKYRVEYDTCGMSNYALTIVLKEKNKETYGKLISKLRENGVEFRQGTAGGGNIMRQPFIRKLFNEDVYKDYPEVEHIHHYGLYIGNYPSLQYENIKRVCHILNEI